MWIRPQQRKVKLKGKKGKERERKEICVGEVYTLLRIKVKVNGKHKASGTKSNSKLKHIPLCLSSLSTCLDYYYQPNLS